MFKTQIFVKKFLNRQVYNSFLKDTKLTLPERQNIYQKMYKIKYSSSIVRLKNFCILTVIQDLFIEILNFLGINLT